MLATADEWGFATSRLWRYLAVYFLKPMDAVNDTVTALLVRRMGLEEDFIELGSGDGLYTFILGGGRLPLSFDRYQTVDLSLEDIYDNTEYRRPTRAAKVRTAKVRPQIQVDAKSSHCLRINDLDPASAPILAALEHLPIDSGCAKRIFFYTPHGVTDHWRSLQEAVRILHPEGRLILLRFDSATLKEFTCHNLAKATRGALGAYLGRLAGARLEEIAPMAATLDEWHAHFSALGLYVEREDSGLALGAWNIYDVQTRPLLKPLIRFFNALPPQLRLGAKLAWMLLFYPVALLGLLTLSRLSSSRPNTCYRVWRLGLAPHAHEHRAHEAGLG